MLKRKVLAVVVKLSAGALGLARWAGLGAYAEVVG